ncbi:vesicle transport v-SNARE protein Gos1 [Zymoseptoria brevis]|uniref:Golgi SNAP receptor complex member 1 n=1 Tax=Zymoseptoria brevis TaxID=1047168 RepID=A0A0F4GRG0_9PEZI|nr:vesicle transport v-SNARE protein Gos1 [Zymoseptoria brevis]
MASATAGWAQLRQQARAQETQTESLFHTYAQYASKADIEPKPSEEESKTEEQLNEILEKRTALLGQLARTLDSEPTPSALKSTNLARHREILTQHRTELARLKAQITHARDRANLLSNVRNDIDAYRSAQNPEAQEAEYMLNERRRIDNSHNMADSVLSQAYAVNESFGLQRESLVGIQRRITGAAAQIPGINGLMQRIGSKKRRDGIILGSFIALCFLALLWFW